jgi:hypothetical protein
MLAVWGVRRQIRVGASPPYTPQVKAVLGGWTMPIAFTWTRTLAQSIWASFPATKSLVRARSLFAEAAWP